MSEYNIQLTSNLTGVTIHTLRAWEKRYQAVVPDRTDSGRRVYNDDHIKKLKALQKLCNFGHSISTIAQKEINELEEMLEKYGVENQTQFEGFNYTKGAEDAEKTLSHLLLALQNFRLDIISHELYSLKMTLPLRDFALKVIAPLLRNVGKMVESGSISIAQEHALSSIVKFHLGKFIYKSYEEKNKSNNLYLLATPEGDYHEFGIFLSAMLLSHYGCNYFYLGPNLPADSLSSTAKSIGANRIILGTVSFQGQSDQTLTSYLTNILNELPISTQLHVGGSGHYNYNKFKNKKNFNTLITLEELDSLLKRDK